jgi:hypothetical protein
VSLGRLHDDCLGEIYKWCPDREAKRNLRQACRLTHSSPAINSQLGTLEGDLREPLDVLAAVRSFPKHATLQCLHLGWRRKSSESFSHACADEACRRKLGGLKELRNLVSCLAMCHAPSAQT